MGKLILKRIKLNRYSVLRLVDEETGEKKVVKNGVDDEDNYFLKNPMKYPNQVRYHKEYLKKHGKK